MTEQWRAVVGYEDVYEVSDLGNVRSLDREDAAGAKRKGKVLSPGISNGYRYVILCEDGQTKGFSVHTLVLEAFEGEAPEGKVPTHVNRIKLDDRLVNLRYAKRPSKPHKGADNGNARLSDDDVAELRSRAADGEIQKSLAYEFGVSETQTSRIVRGNSWQHLTETAS